MKTISDYAEYRSVINRINSLLQKELLRAEEHDEIKYLTESAINYETQTYDYSLHSRIPHIHMTAINPSNHSVRI